MTNQDQQRRNRIETALTRPATFVDYLAEHSDPADVHRYEDGDYRLRWNAFLYSIDDIADLCDLDPDMFDAVNGFVELHIPAEIAGSEV